MLRPLVFLSGWIGRATDAARELAGPRLWKWDIIGISVLW
jgi:hypothetical protein